jgi:hypothetical protein
MSQFDHGELPPELRDVADVLRRDRYHASDLELDQIKTRTMRRAAAVRATRGGLMRKRTLLTTLIMLGAIGTGSATAFSIGGISLPNITSFLNAGSLFGNRPAPSRPPVTLPGVPTVPGVPTGGVTPPGSAAAAVYGQGHVIFLVLCSPVRHLRIGRTVSCRAVVIGLGRGRPTGTVSFTSSSAGTFFPPTCTLSRAGSCRTSYAPAVPGLHRITGHYSGDANYAPATSTFPGFTVIL